VVSTVQRTEMWTVCKNLCTELTNIFSANSKATIWLAGDLNLPGVNWSSCCVTSYQYPKSLNDCFLNMTADFGLDQIVNFGTRNDSTLDIFLTRLWHVTISCQPDGSPPQPVRPWKTGRVHLEPRAAMFVCQSSRNVAHV